MKKPISLFLLAPFLMASFLFSMCACPKVEASISSKHILEASHNCCCPGNAKQCESKIPIICEVQQTDEVVVSSLRAQRSNLDVLRSLRRSFGTSRDDGLLKPDIGRTALPQSISSHLLTSSISIPQSLFPKSPILRL